MLDDVERVRGVIAARGRVLDEVEDLVGAVDAFALGVAACPGDEDLVEIDAMDPADGLPYDAHPETVSAAEFDGRLLTLEHFRNELVAREEEHQAAWVFTPHLSRHRSHLGRTEPVEVLDLHAILRFAHVRRFGTCRVKSLLLTPRVAA